MACSDVEERGEPIAGGVGVCGEDGEMQGYQSAHRTARVGCARRDTADDPNFHLYKRVSSPLSWQSDCAMWPLCLGAGRGRLSLGLGSVAHFFNYLSAQAIPMTIVC
uniref:Uncharacterized protein n=1 Tax=Knipowitschia caucasica TaxID=637954 RepID=A0AAV2KQG7_KNICA